MRANTSPDIKVFLIGNKADLEDSRLITKEQGEKLKNEYDLDNFMETSAKSGFNTIELFAEAAKLLYNNFIKYKKKQKKFEENLRVGKLHLNKKKRKCC